MASVHDVAAAILEKSQPISTMKLQKLVYYSQAWHLVWDDRPLFDERIEAWAGGPVVRELYERHRGTYWVDSWPPGNARALSESELETVRIVVDAYGKMTGRQLSELTHLEFPWRNARRGLGPGERGSREITLESMADYYSALDRDESAQEVGALSISEDDEIF